MVACSETDGDDYTLLHHAVARGDLPTVRLLLAERVVDVEARDGAQSTQTVQSQTETGAGVGGGARLIKSASAAGTYTLLLCAQSLCNSAHVCVPCTPNNNCQKGRWQG